MNDRDAISYIWTAPLHFRINELYSCQTCISPFESVPQFERTTSCVNNSKFTKGDSKTWVWYTNALGATESGNVFGNCGWVGQGDVNKTTAERLQITVRELWGTSWERGGLRHSSLGGKTQESAHSTLVWCLWDVRRSHLLLHHANVVRFWLCKIDCFARL